MLPWRQCGLPALINNREGSLMNSIQYVNQAHMRTIKKIKHARENQVTRRFVHEFREDPQTGTIGVFQLGDEPIKPTDIPDTTPSVLRKRKHRDYDDLDSFGELLQRLPATVKKTESISKGLDQAEYLD